MGALIVAHAEEDNSIFEAFLRATPIYPQVKPPDVVKVDEEIHQSKVELFTDRANFLPSRDEYNCSFDKVDLKPGDYGVIQTPNYPENYPAGRSCQWYLQCDEDSRIEVTVFDLYTQPWLFTYFDYVQFSTDGNMTNAERMSGDLNSRTPFTIVSQANKLGIRFRSSTLFNFRGLKLHYLVKPTDPEKYEDVKFSPFDGVCGQSQILFQDDETTQRPALPGVVPEFPVLNPTSSPNRHVLGETTTQRGPAWLPPHLTNHVPILGSLAEGQTNQETGDPKIIGPGEAPAGAYPWMAALLVDGRSFCGGSLIDQYHILTAAHCTDGATRITAVLGTNNLKQPAVGRLVFNVTREGIFQHPKYNPSTVSHDISIIRLPERVEFNDNIRPICLPTRFFGSSTFQGQLTRVMGWGKPSDKAVSVSPVLKNVTIAVMSNRQCRAFFRSAVTGNQICTATKTTVSPCRGDSGGPLIIREQSPDGNPFYMQVGIVSFGSTTCERGYPVAFTRVTAFLDYISQVTGKPI